MITMFAARLLCVLAVLAPAVLAQPTQATAKAQLSRLHYAPSYEGQQTRIDSWMVGCAAGLIEGAPLRPAVEMAHVVNDGANLLPIARLGTTERLYLRGADLAIVNSGACALLAQAERLECLEKLSREIAPRPPSAVSFSTWVADVQQAPFPSLISHRSIFWRVSWPIGIRLLGLWLVQQPQLSVTW